MRYNPLLQTDVYKMSHMECYAPGCDFVYSYLTARSTKNFKQSVFFGLQYYLDEYLSARLTPDMADEFLAYREAILSRPNSPAVEQKVHALCELGYFPLSIKAVPEGSVVPVRNALLTICHTIPEFYWTVGFVESMLLKVWYPTTVATCCYQYRDTLSRAFADTVDPADYDSMPFTVHDFGYRGDTSEEGAGISGVAHLLSFTGSDTVVALPTAIRYYGAPLDNSVMQSVPASEHSVMSSFGRDDELGAFRHILDTYPDGIVSIVSDTFNVWRALTEFAKKLKPQILARNGKTVFRPDSGNPEFIICGNPDAEPDSLEWLGAIELLGCEFGYSVNSKGYKVLNPKVGLIYGDGMYLERYQRILARMAVKGWAASNLIIGVGGILRNWSRDALGMALKATCVRVNGEVREIEKDPVTDPGKKSAKGLLRVDQYPGNIWVTTDCVTPEQEAGGELREVFRDGKLLIKQDLASLRERVRLSCSPQNFAPRPKQKILELVTASPVRAAGPATKLPVHV